MGQVVCTDMEKAQGRHDLFVVHVLHVPGIRRMLLTSRPSDQPRQALSVRTPGVEPGPQAWGACMMPLHYVRWWQCASGEVQYAAAMRRNPKNAWLPRRYAWDWGKFCALAWRERKPGSSLLWCMCPCARYSQDVADVQARCPVQAGLVGARAGSQTRVTSMGLV